MISYFKQGQVKANIEALKDFDKRIAENLQRQEALKHKELDLKSELQKLLSDVDILERKIAREITHGG